MLPQFFKSPNFASFAGGVVASSILWLFFSTSRRLIIRDDETESMSGKAGLPQPKKLMQEQRPRIVLFGDSLTQQGFDTKTDGWAAQLANLYQRRCDIINRGFSGYNSRWNRLMLQKIFPATDPSPVLVSIFLGANDAALEGFPQHVPVKEYEDNLKEIINYLRRTYPGVSLCLITPPPVNEDKWGAFAHSQGRTLDRKDTVTKLYVDACLAVSSEMQVPAVNSYATMEGGSQSSCALYLSDGLHLSERGNDVLFKKLEECLSSNFKHLYPPEEALDMQGPYWADVNPMAPEHITDGM